MSYIPVKLEPSSPSPSPSARPPRLSAVSNARLTHDLFNGGALDSQVSDSQYLNDLAADASSSPTRQDASFQSSGSSDTAYDPELDTWAGAHSQGDENPEYEKYYKKIMADGGLDDPMDSSEDARPTTPDFLRYYSDLNPDNIRLSTTEVRVIAAIRADKHVTENECARREQEW
ncbi:hypothetical protein R3P38DRAFT_3212863 [Favolaschia claudopus]|uniref:Uncharacterized protein n=1 Tax=Favolaschia claudopus TaxID=2862362 RepID=A0AAW0ADX1_9AGAR